MRMKVPKTSLEFERNTYDFQLTTDNKLDIWNRTKYNNSSSMVEIKELPDGASVMNQIEDTSHEIKECYERLDAIETRLKRRRYPSGEKNRLENEVKDIKTHLSKHEKDLRYLRGENRVAMMLSVLLLAVGLMIYFAYTMVVGS